MIKIINSREYNAIHSKPVIVVMMMERVLMCVDASLCWDMKSQNHDTEMLFPFLYQNASCQLRETMVVPSTANEMLEPRHVSHSVSLFKDSRNVQHSQCRTNRVLFVRTSQEWRASSCSGLFRVELPKRAMRH